MRRIPALVLTLGLLALAGCCCNDHHEKMAMTDACSHCSGQQKLTSKGACEACGMTMDACAGCPGEQTVTADGRCSGCGMQLALAK